MGKAIDEIGNTYGKLTVISKHSSSNSGLKWLCSCGCGNECYVDGISLRKGRTKSCGCTLNTYNYYVGYVDIVTRKNGTIRIDEEDMHLIKGRTWHIDSCGYAAARVNGKLVRMHRLLLGYPHGSVDHIDGDRTNNRRHNLRVVTQVENSRNSKMFITNTSGVKGVSLFTKTGRWQARVGLLGKTVHLGYFAEKEDAVHARKEAEIKYYGEFMRR